MSHTDKPHRDYFELIASARDLASNNGWNESLLGSFAVSGKTYDIPVFTYGASKAHPEYPEFCIGAGIHGDEPASPAAALKLLEIMPSWAEISGRGVSLIVCENPTGYESDTRENFNKVDLNRGWRGDTVEPEVAILRPYFAVRPFGLTIELHEDVDTPGFYLYERINSADEAAGEIRFGPPIIAAVQEAGLAVNFDSMIDGFPAQGGIIHPQVIPEEMPGWPKALFNHVTHARHTLTFESAPCLPIETRVEMLTVAVRTALRVYTSGQLPP